ncbi:hypothetical protein [Microtetraspora malaysiensis]|nr:hypothetical protein [Microtetraspora malaysiensis]
MSMRAADARWQAAARHAKNLFSSWIAHHRPTGGCAPPGSSNC